MDGLANVGTESSAIPQSLQKLSVSTVIVPGPTLLGMSLYKVLGWTLQDLAYAYDFQVPTTICGTRLQYNRNNVFSCAPQIFRKRQYSARLPRCS